MDATRSRKKRRGLRASGDEATIGRIATLAGVSKMTVSRVLRGNGSFSQEARERVMRAVAETGYVPNRLAGTLASARSTLVAVIVPTLENIAFTHVLSGISEVLEPTGRQVVLGVTEYDPEVELDLVETMLSWRPCGLIVSGLEHLPRTADIMRSAGVPIVEIMDIDGEGIDMSVGLSQTAAGAAMADYFVARGYRHIAYAGTKLDVDLRAQKRLDGFKQRLTECDQRVETVEMATETSSLPLGAELLDRVLTREPMIDAIYFTNDDLAVGAVLRCLARKIDVPKAIAVAGFNGLDIGQALPSPLTTVTTPRKRIGTEAANLLLERLAGDMRKKQVDVGFELVRGGTA